MGHVTSHNFLPTLPLFFHSSLSPNRCGWQIGAPMMRDGLRRPGVSFDGRVSRRHRTAQAPPIIIHPAAPPVHTHSPLSTSLLARVLAGIPRAVAAAVAAAARLRRRRRCLPTSSSSLPAYVQSLPLGLIARRRIDESPFHRR